MNNIVRNEIPVDKVDWLVNHYIARMMFKKFLQIHIAPGDGVSSLSLISLDAIFTSAVDGLKTELDVVANMNEKAIASSPGDGKDPPSQSSRKNGAYEK